MLRVFLSSNWGNLFRHFFRIRISSNLKKYFVILVHNASSSQCNEDSVSSKSRCSIVNSRTFSWGFAFRQKSRDILTKWSSKATKLGLRIDGSSKVKVLFLRVCVGSRTFVLHRHTHRRVKFLKILGGLKNHGVSIEDQWPWFFNEDVGRGGGNTVI